jgi:hypothetical protein
MRLALQCSLSVVLMVSSLGAQPKYIGAGGCSSSNCHGGTTPLKESDSRIWGNEFTVWSVSDKHSRAAKVLDDPRGKRMAEILGIKDAKTDAKCVNCHVAGSPAKTAASDGVACEACHGPAEKWLGPHTQKDSHAASVANGMVDTKNLALRTKNCLGCHLGSANQVVDHALIAAGHPDLQFEMDTFSVAQPAHYREIKPSSGNSLPHVRDWAVGQASALGEGMRVLALRANTSWPEFSEMDCLQCHHDLRAESWRINRGYAGRKPGALQLNQSRLEVFRILAQQALPDQGSGIDAAVRQLSGIVANRLHDGAATAQAAGAVARMADEVAARMAAMDFTADKAKGMVRALSAGIPRIASQGVHAAEQATMSLDSLGAAVSGGKLQQPIAELYNYLEQPSAYDPNTFVSLFRKAAAQVN